MSEKANISQVDDMVLYGNSGVLVRFGFVITLFFQGGGESSTRSGLFEVMKSYYEAFSDTLTHFQPPGARSFRKIVDRGFLRKYEVASLSDTNFKDGLDYAICGFPNGYTGEPPIWAFFAVATAPSELYPADVSHLDMYIPASWVERNGLDKIIGMVTGWCSLIKPLHGTAGLGTFIDLGSLPQKAGLISFPILKRFPGFDFNNSIAWKVASCRSRTPCIRTTNWLTILSDQYTEIAGGRAMIESAFETIAYPGGLIARAGDRPEIGDINLGKRCPSYTPIALATKGLRFTGFSHYNSYFSLVPEPLDNLRETLLWLDRFDRA